MRSRSFLRDSVSILTTRVFMLAVALLTSVLLARLLGPEGKGTFSTLLVYSGLIVAVAELGIRQATIYQIGSGVHDEAAVVETVYFMLMASSALGILILWLIYALPSSNRIGLPIALLVSCLIPVQLTSRYMTGIFLGRQEIARFNRTSWMPPVANVLLLAMFVWLLDGGVAGALLALLIANALVGVYSVILSARGGNIRVRLHTQVAIEMVKLGAVYAAASFVLLLNYRVGIVVLERMVPIGDVGRYALAVSIAELIWQVPAVVGAVVFTRSSAAKERSVFTAKVLSLFRVSLLVGAMAGIALAMVGPKLISIVFGRDFEESGTILRLLIPGVVVMIAQKVLNMDLAGQGKPHAGLVLFFLSAMINALLCLLLVPHYGVYGAGISSTMSYLFAAGAFLILYCRTVGVAVKEVLSYRRTDFAFLQPLIKRGLRKLMP